jgi:glycosyltransferase involved in cell wall biosynthesis
VLGGSEIVILDLLKGIDYETNSVLLASHADVFTGLVRNLALPVTCLPLTADFTGGYLHVFISWLRYLKPLRPDKIILAEGEFRDFPLATALAAYAIARGNVWMMELHPAPEPTSQRSRACWGLIPLSAREGVRARLTRGIISDSQGVKNRLVQGYGYTPEKINVVYHGVDTKRFSPASQESRNSLRRELQIPSEAIVVVSTARLDQCKRLDRLIEAFGVLSMEQENLLLLLTGNGPLENELKNLAQSASNSGNIRFLGHVDDVAGVLQASDIYVLPSDQEGFGIALVEAMACGLACVATKTIGPSEIIQDGFNGILTELNYDGVCKGLSEVLRLGAKERKALGNRARQRVLQSFRVEEAVAKTLEFMKINPAIQKSP